MFKKILRFILRITWFILGALFTLILGILSVLIAISIDGTLGFYPNSSTPSLISYIIVIFILLFIAIKIRKKNRAFSIGILLLIPIAFLLPIGNMNYRYVMESARFTNKVTPTTDQNSPTGVYIPENLEDCFQELQKMLPPDFLKQFKSEKENKLSKYDCSLECWIRSNWILYSDESRLTKYFNQLGISNDYIMSEIIVTSFWRYLNNKPLQLEEQIKKNKTK